MHNVFFYTLYSNKQDVISNHNELFDYFITQDLYISHFKKFSSSNKPEKLLVVPWTISIHTKKNIQKTEDAQTGYR